MSKIDMGVSESYRRGRQFVIEKPGSVFLALASIIVFWDLL